MHALNTNALPTFVRNPVFMKIVTIIGARPQFIKAAVVSRALRKDGNFQEVLVHTGQHYDANMSDVFFKELEITEPKYNLGIHAVSNSEMTARMMQSLHGVLKSEMPDMVLVYGDTNSTLAGAMVAKQNHFKLAHVEAGLRSFNMLMAEELNRVIADRLSDVLFCPTQTAVDNLKREGFENYLSEMVLCGDVMYDATLFYRDKAEKQSEIISKLKLEDYILVTMHRPENVDHAESLAAIVDALNELNKKIRVVLPLHPRTKKQLAEWNLKFSFETISPVGYLDMIKLLNHCKLVMTDSGGLQKEAFFFRKHCIILRNETEWTELVQHGLNVLTGADKNKILEAFEIMMIKNSDFDLHFYGNGDAGKIIADSLRNSI